MLWDAETYERVTSIPEIWAEKALTGGSGKARERVTDAGCGIVKLTRILAQKVPSSVVYAVDNDSNMIQVVSRNLKGIGNV